MKATGSTIKLMAKEDVFTQMVMSIMVAGRLTYIMAVALTRLQMVQSTQVTGLKVKSTVTA